MIKTSQIIKYARYYIFLEYSDFPRARNRVYRRPCNGPISSGNIRLIESTDHIYPKHRDSQEHLPVHRMFSDQSGLSSAIHQYSKVSSSAIVLSHETLRNVYDDSSYTASGCAPDEYPYILCRWLQSLCMYYRWNCMYAHRTLWHSMSTISQAAKLQSMWIPSSFQPAKVQKTCEFTHINRKGPALWKEVCIFACSEGKQKRLYEEFF